MSRSGYVDEMDDNWSLIRYRGAVASASKGRRGQALFKELAQQMAAMPRKRLIANDLVCDGDVCALGVVGKARNIDMSSLDPDDPESIAQQFDIAPALAREIVWMNDEYCYREETPEHRWSRMRQWVDGQIQSLADDND